MEFKGRISEVMEPQTGMSQRTGNEWKTQEFIFEYFEHPTDRYADKVVLQTFDTAVMEKLKVGTECICGFGHTVDKYNGRSYNRIRMYKFEALTDKQPATSPIPPAMQPAVAAEPTGQDKTEKNEAFESLTPADELPF